MITKKCMYTISAILIIIVAAIAYVLYPHDKKENVDYENLMKAWDYLRAQIVEFPFGNLVREHPDSNVCWLNDAWLAAKALAKLYPMEPQNLTKALDYFNFTVHEHLCIIFGDTENFAGPFGMALHPKVYGNYTSMAGEFHQIKDYVPDRKIFMFNFADYADLLAEAVMFEHYTGHDWKAKKLYDQLREMWNGTGLVDRIAREGGENELPHFDTYKLALACLAAQLMDDESSANQMMYAIMKNQYAQPGEYQWGFITWYSKLGDPLNPDIPTNVETTTLCLIALSPFIISQPLCGLPIRVGAFYYVWYKEGLEGWNTTYGVVKDIPILGLYSSQNMTVIQQHLEWFRDLDLDFLIVSWWGKNSYTDNSTKILFSEIENRNYTIKVTIMVEKYAENVNFTEVYDYVYDTYSYHPNYMMLNGNPLLCFFNPLKPPSNDNFTIRVLGGMSYVDWVFWSIPPTLSNDGFVSILPRYDDYFMYLAGIRESYQRHNPMLIQGLYDEQWSTVINWLEEGKDVKLITIYSWNEIPERSMIEPHIGMNGKYILSLYCKTKYYIHQIKSLGCL